MTTAPSPTQRGTNLRALSGNQAGERPTQAGYITAYQFGDPPKPAKTVPSPIPAYHSLTRFVRVAPKAMTGLVRFGVVSREESERFLKDLQKIWTYYHELNNRWTMLNEDGQRHRLLKLSWTWKTLMEPHIEFLQLTSDVAEVLELMGELSEEDVRMVKRRIALLQSIILGLKKRVKAVKGY